MSMSNTAENNVLKALLQGIDIDFRASANLYLALFTADPTESGVFTKYVKDNSHFKTKITIVGD